MPQQFVSPSQNAELQAAMRRQKGQLWIMKPKASSQGKGISVISSFDEIPRGAGLKALIVQQYIQDPLLIDGYKFDLRVYVALTSVNPLRLYVYDEGLVRFASERYDTTDLKNVFSHLTNYSINKRNNDQAAQKGRQGSKLQTEDEWEQNIN
jgi:tubulin polyglutamylase TTLL5